MKEIRYIDLGYTSLPKLHAVEEAIAKVGAPTLMLWIAHPPTVSVGYFQNVKEEVNVEEAKKLGLTIARRPSGGGAVLFDEKELYYSIVAKWDSGILPRAPRACFEIATEGLIFALKDWGIYARFAGKNDVQVNGKKISGNAQTNKQRAKIQHGTFLVDFDVATAAKVLKIPTEKIADKGISADAMPEMIEKRIITLNKLLGRKVAMEEAKEVLKKGFAKALNVKLIEGRLTREEEKLSSKFVSKYAKPEWIYRR